MSSDSRLRSDNFLPMMPGEGSSDYRKRVQREQAEKNVRRQAEIDQQTSLRNIPEQRILWWERVHFTRLPTDPKHPLVGVVAAQTALSLEQVQLEQQRRQSAASAIADDKLKQQSLMHSDSRP